MNVIIYLVMESMDSITRSHPEKSTSHTYKTDDKHIQPHTALTINERKSAEPNLITAQSTAYEPPEDGRMSGPKHVEVFNSFLVF